MDTIRTALIIAEAAVEQAIREARQADPKKDLDDEAYQVLRRLSASIYDARVNHFTYKYTS